MKRLMFAVVIMLSLVLVGATPATGGDDVQCVGVFTGIADNVTVPSGAECTIEGATVRGNVIAEQDSALEVVASTVNGNVEVKALAMGTAFQSQIDGSVTCDDCEFQDVVESTVGGNVQIKGADEGDFIIDSTIRGDLQIQESSAGAFAFVIGGTTPTSSTIAGDVKLEKNTGPLVIDTNTIVGDLQLYESNVAGSCPPANCGEPVIVNGTVARNQVGGNAQIFKNEGPLAITGNQIAASLQCFENNPPPASSGNTAREKEGQCLA